VIKRARAGQRELAPHEPDDVVDLARRDPELAGEHRTRLADDGEPRAGDPARCGRAVDLVMWRFLPHRLPAAAPGAGLGGDAEAAGEDRGDAVGDGAPVQVGERARPGEIGEVRGAVRAIGVEPTQAAAARCGTTTRVPLRLNAALTISP
jgi:hypothetical protein